MILFQINREAAPKPSEIPEKFLSYIRDLKNQGEIVSKPSSLPADAMKWQSDLMKLAGNSNDKYFSFLAAIISGPSETFSGAEKYIAGFFYGLKLNISMSDFMEKSGSMPDREALKLHFFDVFSNIGGVTEYEADMAANGAALASELVYYNEKVKESPVFKKQKTQKKSIGVNTDLGIVKTGKPVEYAQVKLPTLYPVSFERPPAIFVSYDFPGANVFQGIINDAVKSLGGVPDQDMGVFRNFPPSYVSGANMVKYKQVLQKFEDWLKVGFKDKNGVQWNSVEEYLKKNDLKSEADFGAFKSALLNGQFKEAISYLKENSPTYNSLGTSVTESQNIASVLDKKALASLLNYSFSTEGAVNYQLNKKGSLAMQVFLRYDGTVLVTNEQINTLTTGMSLLANINPTDTKLKLTTGGQFTTKGEPEWFIQAGADQKIPLAGYVSGVMRGGLSVIMGKQHDPIWGADVETGVKVDTPHIVAEITFSKAFSPAKEDDETFFKNVYTQTTLGYRFSTATMVSVTAGTILNKSSAFGDSSMPWYIKLGVSVNL